ncbi:hypothetical protein VP01_1654g2 [Puccinia sorghi]|uniref:Uncharacterized protein n=1 Tax=Puccinia sorghi TaxID=27349 RepID=A0A0L6VH20_9BASI|nr:hypothetical protein VP01_1654g2 [Puccinia sorghi]
MFDAIARCPKLMRRHSTHKGPLSRHSSSDETRGTFENPWPSSCSSSAGSLFSHSGDSQRSGYSFKQTLAKFREQRLRPLRIFNGNAKVVRNHRISHSCGSIDSIDDVQLPVGTPGHRQSTSTYSPHIISRASLGNRSAEAAIEYHPERMLQDLRPSVFHSFSSVLPQYPPGELSKDGRKMWSYSPDNPACGEIPADKLVAEEESDGSLDDEILDTLCTLRYTVQKIKEHQRQSPKSSPLAQCNSLPAWGAASTGHNNLSRSLSAPCSRPCERGPVSSLGLVNSGLPHCSPCPAHLLPIDQSAPMHAEKDCNLIGLPNPGMIENEDDAGDDSSSFCTLSEEEPDYQSLPYVLPIWPNFPSSFCLSTL